ncbi:MAG: UDP-3-O-acyl-N-acetylglucosamine deacetylase [Synergistaceae bacterium]|nr:UDP-3-O-acyl-N-acetylglucosamine deacetylase [Synergistaceae bacterium]
MPRTISERIEFTGVGLHSGEISTVAVAPSQKEGIYFSTEKGLFSVTSVQVVEDRRLTGFMLPDGTVVRTAEHLLAALTGLDIDSAVISLAGEEVPILDGSPYPFALGFSKVGTAEYGGEHRKKNFLTVPVTVDDPERDRSIMALPAERLKVTYVIDYPGTPVGTQRTSSLISPEVFLNRISKARTFGFTSELDYLKKNGLAKGGGLDNALVFDGIGLLNDGGLRFPLECVTHKINDLLGDLALLGNIPVAHYIGICAGHDLHGRLVDRIKKVL